MSSCKIIMSTCQRLDPAMTSMSQGSQGKGAGRELGKSALLLSNPMNMNQVQAREMPILFIPPGFV